jgi:L-asparagine transporter-like permease
MWFTVFGEHGFPGFIIWVALIASCFLSLRQLTIYAREHPDLAWIANYADALKLSFIAFLVGGSFFDSAYFDMFYQLIAVVVILGVQADELAAVRPGAPYRDIGAPVPVGPTEPLVSERT